MKKRITLLAAIMVIAAASVQAQSFKVIVNNANSTSSLTKSEASNYFLKKRAKWSNGAEINPVDQSSKSATRETFSKEVLGKTTAQVRAFWQQSVFAGKDTPPREVDNDNAVIEYVKSSPGAIGYVSAAANTSEVKVINVE
jgi:ABC-type phosphate transport system substrate-binding protein